MFGFPDELHCSSAACVDAFSGSAGIAVVDHQSVPYRFEDVHKGVLYYSILIERELVDDALLRFVDGLLGI